MDLSSNNLFSAPNYLDRYLRGGSGGGGGGGSRGGGSSGGYDESGGSGGNVPIFVWIIAGIVPIALGVCFCLKIRKQRQGKAAFEETVNKAKVAVEQSSRATLSYERALPHSGEYSTEYLDQGTKRTGTIALTFTDNHTDGYTLSGNGSDVDGSTNIEDGHTSYDGMAWWREKNVTGDVGMQVLSKGKFDFEKHTFQGEWCSSTNLDGIYTSFSAKDPPASSVAAPSAPEDDVDIRIDSDYAPSVSAEPSKY